MSEGGSGYGHICWLEIPVSDFSRAEKLYTEIFGWEFNPEPMPMGEHGVKELRMFSSPKKQSNGALLVMEDGYQMTRYGKLEKEVLPPIPTFCVEECDETLKKVSGLGGSTQCPKTQIPNDMGYFARFNDSEGNVIGIFSMK